MVSTCLDMFSISPNTPLALFYPIPLVLCPKVPKLPEGGPHTLPTSSSDNSVGVQFDLGLEIVQDITVLPYHGLGTNLRPSCKCVWEYYPVGI